MLLAHVSDLHIGRDATTDAAAGRLAAALEREGVAAALLTGDVTHRGRLAELARFEALFRPLLHAGRLIVVPGNHDRMSDDVAGAMMRGERVQVESRPGLHAVRLDSTAPHNRSLIDAHGLLTEEDVAAVEAALDRAPPGALSVLLLHHHVLPLPEELFGERLAALLGWPNAAELALGARLLERIRGRCDLVLHGHRHAPSELILGASEARPLRVLNAGSTTELGRFRLLSAHGPGPATDRWTTTSVPSLGMALGGERAAA
ncbi:MAG TPA: metallophosphoesterase [Anaeromyxobacter sp.]|nr:metallophosphoesterase [Anaeromyxobacter sp.]